LLAIAGRRELSGGWEIARIVFNAPFMGGMLAIMVGIGVVIVFVVLIVLQDLLLVPVGILISVAVAAFGWELIFHSLFLDIMVEITPPGTWRVEQIRPQFTDPRGLAHSQAYVDQNALRVVADWIRKRSIQAAASNES
jgi:hypothetical protein